jgi:hypothetical protein
MAFDDSTGALDRAHYARPDGLWGNDLGDYSAESVFEFLRIREERAEADFRVDEPQRLKYQERLARRQADATRSRAKPVEERIARERAEKSRGTFGHLLAKAFARDKKR